MRRVVVLRPEPDASATAERARERGLEPLMLPLFAVEPVAWDPPQTGGFDGLLLTSANAVRSAGEQLASLRGLPVYAVGEATAEAAREAGFDIASSGESGIDRLLGSLEPDLKLLHLSGEHRREPQDARQQIRVIAVYRSRELSDADVRDAASAVVLVHSPRAARRFAELTRQCGIDRSTTAIAAISPAAAETAGDGWAEVEAAESPNDDALLALAARLCNKPPPQ